MFMSKIMKLRNGISSFKGCRCKATYIEKSFGFDTAVEEAQRASNAAHVEAESIENGIGVVKLMRRYSGFIAMYATLASRDVDCCLIPESPFYLEGRGRLLEFVEKWLKENGHMVIVVAEGARQEFVAESMRSMGHEDASENKLFLDVGLWLSQKIKNHFASKQKMVLNLKYIDPTYMIRAVLGNASDNVYCTLLVYSTIHGAMAGYTGFTIGHVNVRHAYISFQGQKYELVATITHHGWEPSKGHYTAGVRGSDGHWLWYDDATVKAMGENVVLHDQDYLLFYKQV